MIKLCMDKTRCKTGLRQRDALSPVLFNIALETLVKKTKNKFDGLNLEDNIRQCGILAYADDIIILESNKQEVIMGTKELIKNSKDIGLQINESKTKYMVTSRRENYGEHLEVENFKRIYGPIRNNITQQYESRSNIELQQLCKEPDIVAVLRYRRITWAGHVWRSNSLMKAVLKWKPSGERPLGRPKQRWIDKVKKTLEEIGIEDMETEAKNKDKWRQICVVVMGLNGL
ncbi:uncharacterized protein LOC126900871 [Daktulosphaira vitifoliae]|uniref:uncharacterized protein LOC126900871 n=1 Tax=Daktulosphaira vitifoliae TaxID=58002 RepID=UPI0021AAAEC1|nr:uncharacterized protein LOC126900871 [Daktulosphaira vitifoliae]